MRVLEIGETPEQTKVSIQFVADQELTDKIEKLKGLLAHTQRKFNAVYKGRPVDLASQTQGERPFRLENLGMLCRPCNQREAIQVFGQEKMNKFLGHKNNGYRKN